MNISLHDQTEQLCLERKDLILTRLKEHHPNDIPPYEPRFLLQHGVIPENVAAFFIHYLDALPVVEYHTSQQLDIETIDALLYKSIVATFQYCTTTRSFLCEYLSDVDGNIRLEQSFVDKLHVLKDRPYFPDILEAWSEHLASNDIHLISRDVLTNHIAEIDNSILRHSTISRFIDYLSPLYDFYNHRDSEPRVEREILSAFFDDRLLTNIAERVAADRRSHLTLRELIELLSNQFPLQKLNVSEKPSEIPSDELVQSNLSSDQYDDFISDLQTAGVVYQTTALHSTALLPFRYFVDKDLKKRVIEKVFHDDKEAYRSFLNTIDNAANIETARLNLETSLRVHGVNIESKTARKLLSALEERYTKQSAR